MTTEDWKGEHFIRDVPRSNPQSDAAKFGNAKRGAGRRDAITRIMAPRPLTRLQQEVFDAIRHRSDTLTAYRLRKSRMHYECNKVTQDLYRRERRA